MSNSVSNATNKFRFRLPPVEANIAIGLAAALFGLSAVQFHDFSLLQLLLLAAFFAVGILMRRPWAIYLMFATFLALKYVLIHPFFKSQFRNLHYSDPFLVFILVMLAAACFRYLESSRFAQAFYPHAKLGEKRDLETRYEFPSLLGGRWWAIPLAIVLAATLMGTSRYQLGFLRQVGITFLASRVIFITLLLFFCWFICRAAVGTFIRWQMGTEQAEIQCRSLIAKEMWREVSPIERRRQKNRSLD